MKTVIMAVGFGSRLWPLSTSEKPKQFQPLIHGTTPLSHTYAALSRIVPEDEIYVQGLEGMQAVIRECLPGIKVENIIITPERRNTLPNTLWALSEITDDPDEPILFKSSDQLILDADEFTESLKAALAAYQNKPHALTVLGPKFTAFNSNDGYFLADSQGKVVKFLEKPSETMLYQSMADLQAYRSSVLHILTKNTVQGALDEIAEDWQPTAKQILAGPKETREKDFLSMPFIDVSPLFATSNLRVLEVQYEFVDVGRFQEVYDLNDKDVDGNVVMGRAILEKSRGNLVINNTDQPLVVIGQENTVIVQTPEGSLVSSFDDAPLVGDIYKTQIHQQ